MSECPRCEWPERSDQEIYDENGQLEETITVCSNCGHYWVEHHWFEITVE